MAVLRPAGFSSVSTAWPATATPSSPTGPPSARPGGALAMSLMDAAGAGIPDSAASRRGMLPALAGLVAGLAYAAISVYWGAGGRWLLNTVGISLSQPGEPGHLAALLAVWGAAAVKAVAALLPLLAI